MWNDDVGVQEDFKNLTIQDEENTPLEVESNKDNFQKNQILEENDKDVGTLIDLPRVWKFVQNHPKKFVIDDPSEKVKTCSSSKELMDNFALVSHFEFKNVVDNLKGEN